MQWDDGRSDHPPYLFERQTYVASDTLIMQGRGPPNRPNGLSRSLFRPSDDAVMMPYNIPGNAMMCVEMTHLMELLSQLRNSQLSVEKLLRQSKSIRSRLCDALLPYTLTLSSPQKMLHTIPYEVDGFGGHYFMDDANIPSLLSLPLLGYMSSSHPSYIQTRNFILSASNPFYYTGSAVSGVGSPHTGVNYSWPLSILVQALTSHDENEITRCLQLLVRAAAGTGFMHESVNVNDPSDYTRPWFAWANGLFGEWILHLLYTRPSLLLGDNPAAIKTVQAVVQPPVSYLSQLETLL